MPAAQQREACSGCRWGRALVARPGSRRARAPARAARRCVGSPALATAIRRSACGSETHTHALRMPPWTRLRQSSRYRVSRSRAWSIAPCASTTATASPSPSGGRGRRDGLAGRDGKALADRRRERIACDGRWKGLHQAEATTMPTGFHNGSTSEPESYGPPKAEPQRRRGAEDPRRKTRRDGWTRQGEYGCAEPQSTFLSCSLVRMRSRQSPSPRPLPRGERGLRSLTRSARLGAMASFALNGKTPRPSLRTGFLCGSSASSRLCGSAVEP